MNRVSHAFGDNKPTAHKVAEDFVRLYIHQQLSNFLTQVATESASLLASVGCPAAVSIEVAEPAFIVGVHHMPVEGQP
jgi:hypothetical protein